MLGGYDSSRCLTDAIAADGWYFDLLDTTVNVSSGGFAWKGVDQGYEEGLLLGNDGNAPGNMSIYPNPLVPYMYLPRATCDAIAALLPVT